MTTANDILDVYVFDETFKAFPRLVISSKAVFHEFSIVNHQMGLPFMRVGNQTNLHAYINSDRAVIHADIDRE